MADETKEKQEKKNSTYKFGQSELDLNSYIQTLGHNLKKIGLKNKDKNLPQPMIDI